MRKSDAFCAGILAGGVVTTLATYFGGMAISKYIKTPEPQRVKLIEESPDELRFSGESGAGIALGLESRFEDDKASFVVKFGDVKNGESVVYGMGVSSGVPMSKSRYDEIYNIVEGELKDGDNDWVNVHGKHLRRSSYDGSYLDVWILDMNFLEIDGKFIDLTHEGGFKVSEK